MAAEDNFMLHSQPVDDSTITGTFPDSLSTNLLARLAYMQVGHDEWTRITESTRDALSVLLTDMFRMGTWENENDPWLERFLGDF